MWVVIKQAIALQPMGHKEHQSIQQYDGRDHQWHVLPQIVLFSAFALGFGEANETHSMAIQRLSDNRNGPTVRQYIVED